MELSIHELDLEVTSVLPAREEMALFNLAGITASNYALALNAVTSHSSAQANAYQAIWVRQK